MMVKDSRSSANPLLLVRGLRTVFHTPHGKARALDSLDLSIQPGEIVGLVGESGSGKTVTALSILGLIRSPGEIESGEISFDGIDLRKLSDEEWSMVRGSRIALIFQDPKVRLNPVFSIGSQLAELIEIHGSFSRRESWRRMLTLLEEVGLPNPEDKAHAYPHELSMGQAQRVMIAMALALEPDLILADEPTSALDATIQDQILTLLEAQQSHVESAILLISHNLAVVAQLAERVIVLYAGHVLEQAPVETLFRQPYHPYTQGLIASIPQNQSPERRMHTIPGSMPDARELPDGCRFHPRCEARKVFDLAICGQQVPALQEVSAGHQVRCWLYQSAGDHRAPLKNGYPTISNQSRSPK
jgi:peptide/nickel transport system ATP-binding protein